MRFLVLGLALTAGTVACFAQSAAEVRFVYMMPMGNGLDQYLANQLTTNNLYQVVTDPKRADAVMTDQIGAAFEQKMESLFPPPKEVEVKEDKDKEAKDEKKPSDFIPERYVPPSTFARGKGNIFLVDVKSRRVLWSTHELSKGVTPEKLHKTSEKIVETLRKEVKGGK